MIPLNDPTGLLDCEVCGYPHYPDQRHVEEPDYDGENKDRRLGL